MLDSSNKAQSSTATRIAKKRYKPEIGGGLVLLSFVSMYASDKGFLRHVTTGSIVKAGWWARASGRI